MAKESIAVAAIQAQIDARMAEKARLLGCVAIEDGVIAGLEASKAAIQLGDGVIVPAATKAPRGRLPSTEVAKRVHAIQGMLRRTGPRKPSDIARDLSAELGVEVPVTRVQDFLRRSNVFVKLGDGYWDVMPGEPVPPTGGSTEAA